MTGALARLEDGPGDRDRVDLDDLIADRVNNWAAYAAEHHVAISTTGGPAGTVWAIPGAIVRLQKAPAVDGRRATTAGTKPRSVTR